MLHTILCTTLLRSRLLQAPPPLPAPFLAMYPYAAATSVPATAALPALSAIQAPATAALAAPPPYQGQAQGHYQGHAMSISFDQSPTSSSPSATALPHGPLQPPLQATGSSPTPPLPYSQAQAQLPATASIQAVSRAAEEEAGMASIMLPSTASYSPAAPVVPTFLLPGALLKP